MHSSCHQDLAHLIQLDFVTHPLFELAPMTEYDLYIQKFGKSESAQVETQTREEILDRGLQTEDYLMEDKWVQATFDMFVDSGTVEPDLPWLPPSHSGSVASKLRQHKGFSADLVKLGAFLKNAGTVC
jgi:hypothetical protein